MSTANHRKPTQRPDWAMYLGTALLAAIGTALALWLGNMPGTRDWGQMVNYAVGLAVGAATWEWTAIRS